MRTLNIDDVIGLNSMTLLAAPIVAQPFGGFRKNPSTEILPLQSERKAAPQADNSPPAPAVSPPAISKHPDLPLGNFWLELHQYVSVGRLKGATRSRAAGR